MFNLQVPTSCPGVPPELLLPSASWADKEGYECELRQLAQRFVTNFERFLVSWGVCARPAAAALGWATLGRSVLCTAAGHRICQGLPYASLSCSLRAQHALAPSQRTVTCLLAGWRRLHDTRCRPQHRRCWAHALALPCARCKHGWRGTHGLSCCPARI